MTALAGTSARAVARFLREASYEVMPFKGAEDKVLSSVPTTVSLSVTTTSARGLGPTLELATRLTAKGYRVAPHLAARQFIDKQHVADVLAQATEAGIVEAFVVGGDLPTPAGRFTDALSLLREIRNQGSPFRRVGIAGYPEGHPSIADDQLARSLVEKSEYADYVVTQMCFDADATSAWAAGLSRAGVVLETRAGVPGAVDRAKLVRVSAGLGLGQSARMLRRQSSTIWRLLRGSGYSSESLVEGLASPSRSTSAVTGIHVYSFNDLEQTEAWRQAWLSKLTAGAR